MKRIVRVLGYVLLSFALLLAAGVAVLFLYFPRTAKASNIVIRPIPARIQRGKYLINPNK